VIDERVVARHLGLELGDDGAAGRHAHGLNAFERRRFQAAKGIKPVEYLADDVERRRKIRSADAEENTHGVSDLRPQRVQFRQRADRPVKDEVFRVLVQQLLDTELGAAVNGIGLGDKVVLVFADDQKRVSVRISESGNDVEKGRLSVASPLGRAILGAEEGDEVELSLENGRQRKVLIESVEKAETPVAANLTSAASQAAAVA
jgi:hypothetical protein